MKMLRLMSWKLDDVLHLRDQAFTDDIETLPLHFETHHWETLYNNGRDWDSLSWGKILHSIKDWETSRVNPPGQNSPKPTSSTNEKTSDVNSSGKKKLSFHRISNRHCNFLWKNGSSSAGTESLCQSKM